MKYGTMYKGCFMPATKMIVYEGKLVADPTAEMLLAAGYKAVIEADKPEAVTPGKRLMPKYTEQEDSILKEWVEVDIQSSGTFPSMKEEMAAMRVDIDETKELLDILMTGAVEDEEE